MNRNDSEPTTSEGISEEALSENSSEKPIATVEGNRSSSSVTCQEECISDVFYNSFNSEYGLIEAEYKPGLDQDVATPSSERIDSKNDPQLPFGSSAPNYAQPGTNLLKRKKGPSRNRMRFLHIFIKYEESETLGSFRQETTPRFRTKAEALEKITSVRNFIKKNPIRCYEIITKLIAARGVKFGPILMGDPINTFKKKLFLLKMYELSEIFETGSGYHMAMRFPIVTPEQQNRQKRLKKKRLDEIDTHELYSQDARLPLNADAPDQHCKREMLAAQQALIKKNVVDNSAVIEESKMKLVKPSAEKSSSDFVLKTPSRLDNSNPDDYHQG